MCPSLPSTREAEERLLSKMRHLFAKSRKLRGSSSEVPSVGSAQYLAHSKCRVTVVLLPARWTSKIGEVRRNHSWSPNQSLLVPKGKPGAWGGDRACSSCAWDSPWDWSLWSPAPGFQTFPSSLTRAGLLPSYRPGWGPALWPFSYVLTFESFPGTRHHFR